MAMQESEFSIEAPPPPPQRLNDSCTQSSSCRLDVISKPCGPPPRGRISKGVTRDGRDWQETRRYRQTSTGTTSKAKTLTLFDF